MELLYRTVIQYEHVLVWAMSLNEPALSGVLMMRQAEGRLRASAEGPTR